MTSARQLQDDQPAQPSCGTGDRDAHRASLARSPHLAPAATVDELCIEPGNEGSLRAAAAAGYRQEALLRGHREIDGHRRDMLLLARLSDPSGHDAPARWSRRLRAPLPTQH